MIKYSGNTINDWWRSSSAITKVMYNGNQAYRRKVRVLPTRWVISVTSFVCENDDRYEKQIKQYSLDDGLTWENYTPEVSRKGSLFESSSTVCISGTQSPMYAVTEQITGYSGSFLYVYESSSNNWYQRENNQYVIYDGDYVRLTPQDNLEFSSMSQAESYEGVWYGQSASISGTDYMFCQTNEYMTKIAYQEVTGEYICQQGNKYKKMQQYDRNVDGTLSAHTPAIYVPGDLIESGSTDCPAIDEYEWIRTENSSSSYYKFDTGFYPTTANTIEIKMEMIDRSVDWGAIIGWASCDGDMCDETQFRFTTVTGEYCIIARKGNTDGIEFNSVGANTPITVTLPLSASTYTCYDGITTYTYNYNIGSFSLPSSIPLNIFSIGYNKPAAVAKIYYVKVYDANNNLVKHYIPSDDNGTPCFYEVVDGDKVLDTYTGENHGTLTLGPAVN